MMPRKKVRIFCLIGVLLVLGGFFLTGKGAIIGRGESQENIDLEIGLWTSGTTIEQTFIASMDHLCRIDFRLDSYHPWDSPYLEFRLFEIETDKKPPELSYEFIKTHSKELRYKKLQGWMMSPHMFNSFSFPPIPRSKDKRYLLSIRSPEIKKGGTSILLASPTDRYLYYGNLFVDGKRQEGDLAFRLLYAKSRVALIQKSFEKLALQKPAFFSKSAAYYVLFIGYILLLGIFLCWVAVL